MTTEQPDILYSTDDNCERLEYDDMEECIYMHLDSQDPEYWDTELRVFGYRRYRFSEAEIKSFALDLGDRLAESMADEHSDPDGGDYPGPSEATMRILECAVQNAVAEWDCWDFVLDASLGVTVNVAEWVRANGADWLEDTKILARLAELEAEMAEERNEQKEQTP